MKNTSKLYFFRNNPRKEDVAEEIGNLANEQIILCKETNERQFYKPQRINWTRRQFKKFNRTKWGKFQICRREFEKSEKTIWWEF